MSESDRALIDQVENFHTDPVLYLEALTEYNTNVRDGLWFTMQDYLKKYNIEDVIILQKGFTNLIEKYQEQDGINPLNYFSLAAVAGKMKYVFCFNIIFKNH